VTLLAPNESLVCVRRFDLTGRVIKENLLKRAVHGDESLGRHGDEILSMRSHDVAERVHAKRTHLELDRLERGSEVARISPCGCQRVTAATIGLSVGRSWSPAQSVRNARPCARHVS
jgi:hypothetical protein